MDYFFNERSLTQMGSKAAAREVMKTFVRVCNILRIKGFEHLRVNEVVATHLRIFAIAEGYTIFDWIDDDQIDEVQKNIYRDIMNRRLAIPLYGADQADFPENFGGYFYETIHNEPQQLTIVDGMIVAMEADSIVASMATEGVWNAHQIDIKQSEIDGEEIVFRNYRKVNHASQLQHIEDHAEWLRRIDHRLTKETGAHRFLPSLIFSDLLVDSWDEYENHLRGKSPEDRIAAFKIMALRVARRNGFFKNDRLTQLNNRLVFDNDAGNKTIYLSLDTLHGRFEICDHKASPQGEYRFNGKQTKDRTQSHGINLG